MSTSKLDEAKEKLFIVKMKYKSLFKLEQVNEAQDKMKNYHTKLDTYERAKKV